jgi:uncharacterized membrane protein
MKPRWAFTILFSLLGATFISLLEQKPSYGWMEICNRTSDKLNIAFAYLDKSEKKQSKNKDNWIAQGWWDVEPSKCAKVFPHALWQKGRYYYFYAKNSQDTRKWYGEGKKSFCIQNDDFKESQSNLDEEKCINTEKKSPPICEKVDDSKCTEENKGKVTPPSYWQKFGLIDIGSKKIENHTLNLK